MKALQTKRRISPGVLVATCLTLVVTVLCVTFAFQTKSEPAANVSELFMTDSIDKRPSITSSVIQQPVSSIQVPPSPVTSDALAVAVTQTAAAQSQTVGSEAVYPSLQITGAQRDRLYIVAVSIAMVGAAMYGMTLLSVAPRTVAVTRRPLYRALDM